MGIEISIKKARKHLRETQVGFAVLLGCSRESVVAWEKGTQEPGFKFVRKTAELCKVRPSKLIQWGE